ncbi:MAG: cyclodeaminase/cyclohydrolase family protein [Desulfosarcina sp.]|nr:cyclodeaminase/cyclohydrolase family protein [Desulfosarcina sp.]MBC2767431.1 cyclodeaminase/cyclohydrolase family protein [Desulfosarcina sp.]
MENNIKAFLRVLDASDNSTGGGTASCVAGSMAAGLVGMVARLSMGKDGLLPTEHYERIGIRAEELAHELFNAGRIDSEAFAVVSSAFKMPKETPEQKQARSLAIQKGMVHCAEVPLANAWLCSEVVHLADKLAEKFNVNATSDLQCGQYLAAAGLKGCAANVRINLPSIKDKAVVERIEGELAAVISETDIV